MGAFLVYAGFLTALAGLVSIMKPVSFLGIRTPRAGGALLAVGVALTAFGMALPAWLLRVEVPRMRLDDYVPAWQFRGVHSIRSTRRGIGSTKRYGK